MTRFRGTDPVVPLLNHVEEVKSGWRYRFFLEDLDLAVDDIVENAAFRVRVDSQYERHYRESYVRPASEQGSVALSRSAGGRASIDPDRPDRYTDDERSYPRAATARDVDCEFCGDGSRACPNCNGEEVVTCPNCHSHRGGDCPTCEATGKVDCSECSGSDVCRGCRGDGQVQCTGCDGTGTVRNRDTIEKTCRNCDGRRTVGGDPCGACGGDGRIRETVTREEQHRACDGTGWQTCTTCGGSGNCPTCNNGLVACDACNGSRICSFCTGDGVEECRTCHGASDVTCPVCRGEGALFLYTVDSYVYTHTVDEDVVFPEPFEDHREEVAFDAVGSVELDGLETDEIEDRLGLLNGRVDRQLEKSRSAFDELVRTAERREFDRGIDVDDRMVQDQALEALVERIESDWQRQPSDSVDADYKLSTGDDERTRTHDDDYETILFDRYTFEMVPLTLVALRTNGRSKELFAAGTRADYDLSLPSFDVSTSKAGSLAGALLGVGAAVFLSPLMGAGVSTILSTGVPWYAVAAALSLVSLASYVGLVYRSTVSEGSKLLTVVGPDDALTTTFLSVLAHTVADEGNGDVRGGIYTKLSEDLFDDLVLGASMTYCIEFEDGRDLRLVGLSNRSYESMDEPVQQLLANSHGVVSVVGGEAADPVPAYEQFRTLAEEHDVEPVVVTDHPDLLAGRDTLDEHVREVPLEKLRERYLDGDPEVDVTVTETVDAVRHGGR